MLPLTASLLPCNDPISTHDLLTTSSITNFIAPSSNLIIDEDRHWYGNTTLDVCRVMLQYAPWKPTPQRYERWMTVFHPVVYDLLLASIKLISVLYLIFFIRHQYKVIQETDKKYEANSNDPTAMFDQSKPHQDSVLIFPLYLRILIVLAILCSYQAAVDIIFPLHPNSKVQNPLVNSITHAIGTGFEHMMLEGVAILLIFQGVGKRTTVKTILTSLLWGFICAGISCWLNLRSLTRLTTFLAGMIWAIFILIFYSALWLLPLTCFHRRPAVLPFARTFCIFHSVNVMAQILMYFKIGIGHCLFHLTHHGILGVLVPYLIYRMLVADSQYWQGLSVDDDEEDDMAPSRRGQDDSIQGALVGITFDPSHARHIAKQMDGTSRVNLISFAAIRLEKNISGSGPRHIILGAGSTARVYRGLYYNRRVAIKTILCLELTQDVISSFYREAALLTNLRHENIVAVEGMCVNPPALCLVMELCGGSLMDLLSTIYNNSHTSATNQPRNHHPNNNHNNNNFNGRQSAGRSSTIRNGNNNTHNNNNSNTRHDDDHHDEIPYFSYYSDQSGAKNVSTKLRRKKPYRSHHPYMIPASGHLDINSSHHHGSIGQPYGSITSTSLLHTTGSATSRSNSISFSPLQSFAATLLPSPFGTSPSTVTLINSQHNPKLIGSASTSVLSISPAKIPLLLTPQYIPEYYDMESVYQHPLDFWKDLLRTDDPSTQEFGGCNGNLTTNDTDIPAPVSLSPNDTVLSWLSRVELMIQCCTSVAFLHNQSPPILHLDIKSSNFLLGFDGRVKLADLELSRQIAMTKDGDITAIPTILSSLTQPQLDSTYANSPFLTPTCPPLGPVTSLQQSSSNGTMNHSSERISPSSSTSSFLETTTSHSNSPDSTLVLLANSPVPVTPPSSIANPSSYTSTHAYSSVTTPTPSTAFLIDLLSDIITNGPTQAIAHDMAHQSRFNGITIPERVNWLAPELMLGHRYDEKVDVYALGCVLYEIVTGKVPFFDLELQLKQLVTLPRGVSVYYHRSTTNSSLAQQQLSPNLHQNNHSNVTASSFLTSSSLTQQHIPRSSTFVNPRQQQQTHALLGFNHKVSDGMPSSGKKGRSENSYHTFFETHKQPPIATTPTTEQIQTAIKVMVAIHHYRPMIPIDTPKIIRDTIEQAWHPNPAMRPSCEHMSQVLTQVKFDLLKDGGLQHIY